MLPTQSKNFSLFLLPYLWEVTSLKVEIQVWRIGACVCVNAFFSLITNYSETFTYSWICGAKGTHKLSVKCKLQNHFGKKKKVVKLKLIYPMTPSPLLDLILRNTHVYQKRWTKMATVHFSQKLEVTQMSINRMCKLWYFQSVEHQLHSTWMILQHNVEGDKAKQNGVSVHIWSSNTKLKCIT